jgi:hypothetical protein
VDGVEFSVFDGRVCLAKLPPSVDASTIVHTPGFFSVTCTEDELSIVAGEQFSHPGAEIQRGWRAIKVKGPLEFELKGVLASLLNPLNEAGISVFALSTYTTDFIFVLDYHLDLAVEVLQAAGHRYLRDS